MKMNVDSDSEESFDPDAAVCFSNLLTRSVFNITVDMAGDDSKEGNESTDYEKRLNAEIDEWLSLLKKTKETISSSSSASKNTDFSVLSEEKIAYFKNAPDLNKFVEESIEFRKEANAYLEKDYADILALHENLSELCTSRLDAKKCDLIKKFVFNVPISHREIN